MENILSYTALFGVVFTAAFAGFGLGWKISTKLNFEKVSKSLSENRKQLERLYEGALKNKLTEKKLKSNLIYPVK